ncbi:MAG: hypothetical protein ACK41P_11580, partial [Asticcacaulis sp.]
MLSIVFRDRLDRWGRRIFATGLAALTCLLATPIPANSAPANPAPTNPTTTPDWISVETPHFRVTGRTSETRLTQLALSLEQFRTTLLADIRPTLHSPEPRFELILVPRESDLLRLRPSLDPAATGFYVPGERDHAAFVADQGPGPETRQFAFHEYAHHIMFRYMVGTYPAWLTEGFAEYYSTLRPVPGGAILGEAAPERLSSLTTDAWQDLIPMLSQANAAAHTHANYYPQAWALTHYFLSTPTRQRQLSSLLRLTALGLPLRDAMERATGQSPEAFAQTLRRYVRGSIPTRQIRMARTTDIPTTRRSLSHAEGALIMEHWLYRLPPAQRDLKAAINAARARLESLPDSLERNRVQASLYLLEHKPNAALAVILPYIHSGLATALDHRMVADAWQAKAQKAEAVDDQGAWLQQARSHYDSATQLDPLDYGALVSLSRAGTALKRMGVKLADDQLNRDALRRAQAIAPQSPLVRSLAGPLPEYDHNLAIEGPETESETETLAVKA